MDTDRNLTEVFHALADLTRRRILKTLKKGPMPVGKIASDFLISRPAVYKHIAVLKEAGLVAENKDGRQVICSLAPRPLRDANEWIEGYRLFWSGKLERLKLYVEAGSRRKTQQHPLKKKRAKK